MFLASSYLTLLFSAPSYFIEIIQGYHNCIPAEFSTCLLPVSRLLYFSFTPYFTSFNIKPRNLSQKHYSLPAMPALVWVRYTSEIPKYTEFPCLYITAPITLGSSSPFTFLAFTTNQEGQDPHPSSLYP